MSKLVTAVRQATLRSVVAAIVVLGHIFLFLYAFFFLGLFGPLYAEDAMQVVLMSTPVIGATATSALNYVIANEVRSAKGKLVSPLFALFCIAIPSILMLCIFVLYMLAASSTSQFGLTDLKLGLGVLETFFGVFVGAISKKLFS